MNVAGAETPAKFWPNIDTIATQRCRLRSRLDPSLS